MSERRVKGWSIKRASHAYWLVDHFGDGTTTWGPKSARIIYGSKETARWARGDAAKNNSGVRLFRVSAKPKAPKPNKLEQAIDVLRARLDEVEDFRRYCGQRGDHYEAHGWEVRADELRLMVKLLEELR